MNARTQYFEAHGDRTAYCLHPGEGTPLLLVHGVGSSRDTWGDVPDRLAALGHQVLTVDLLGHGDSGHGNGDYSLGANATVIRDLLDHLGIDRVHAVGHSLGGGVCMQFTHQFPERVASLTLISSGGLGAEVSTGLRAATLPGASTVISLACSAPVVSTLSYIDALAAGIGKRPPIGHHVVDKMSRLREPERLQAFLATVRSVVGLAGQRVSALNHLHRLDPANVLLIWGDADPMVPLDHGRNAAQMLPGSRLVVVPGAKHHPHTDDPELVAEEIAGHVAACESRQTLSA